MGGFAAGTLGFATEWGWTHVAMPLPWEPALLPEGIVVAAVAGTAGGLLGGLIGTGAAGRAAAAGRRPRGRGGRRGRA